MEYIKSCEQGKIVISCIREKAEQDRFNSFNFVNQLIKEKNMRNDEAREIFKPSYVDSWHVLDFIEKVRKAPINNFLIYFKDPSDLCEILLRRLSGLSNFICHKIIEEQCKSVKSHKTAIFNLSLEDIINKGYFIEPKYKILSGDMSQSEISGICDSSLDDQKIMILGGPGIGKTTLLIKSFLNHADKCLKDKSNKVPFYLSLRGLGPNYHFDFEIYIEECCQQLLKKCGFPLFNVNSIQPVFYIDGFDELVEQSSDEDLKKAVRSKFFSFGFIVNSRTRFANERLQSLEFWSSIQIIIELIPWDSELSWNYIKQFFILRKNLESYNAIFNAYHGSEEMRNIFESPLLLTMFLWIIDESRDMSLPLDIKDRISINDQFINLWIKRDLERISRKESIEIDIKRMRNAWQHAAWEVYKRRFSGDSLNKDQMIELLSGIDQDLTDILVTSAFWDFFDVQHFDNNIRGMLHEQFMEYFLAQEIISSSRDNNCPFPQFLEYEIRWEVNRIIIELWRRAKKEDVRKCLLNLWRCYEEKHDHPDELSIAIRNHAIYYIGRIPDDAAKDKLKLARGIEKDIFVKLSIAFGLIKLEDYEVENELYNDLKSSKLWDQENRGYHLVYYGDWILKGEHPPYIDDCTKSWPKTLNSLLYHIKSQDRSHVALRRIELFTIRRFIESRNDLGPLTEKDMNSICYSLDHMIDKPAGFLDVVKKEFLELQKIVEMLAEQDISK
jgi:hypothetical protein